MLPADTSTYSLRSRIRSILLGLILFLPILVVSLPLSYSEEPAPEGTPKKAKRIRTPKPEVILSFHRYEPAMKEICLVMGVEGRRERLSEIAKSRTRSKESCPSCRAFWISIDRACKVLPIKRDSKTQKKEKADNETEAAEEDTAESSVEETPVPVPTPRLDRYPSAQVLDLTSRLAEELYERDKGDSAKAAIDEVQRVVLGTEDLTPGERDYFGIFLKYLEAPWDGRGPAPAPEKHSPEELEALFIAPLKSLEHK